MITAREILDDDTDAKEEDAVEADTPPPRKAPRVSASRLPGGYGGSSRGEASGKN